MIRTMGGIGLVLCTLAGFLVSQSRAGEVDTVQYGHIEKGMKESEVKSRLGKPDRVVKTEDHKHYKSQGTWREKPVRKIRYVYEGVNPASGQKITTTILFENGKVVEKKRVYK
jgi:hypothetical protein